MEEVELSGSATVGLFRWCGYVVAGFLGLVGPLMAFGGPRGLADPPADAVMLTVLFVSVATYLIVRQRGVKQVTATPLGLRTDRQFVPWAQVRGIEVSAQGWTRIRHDGGIIRTLFLMPWPPGNHDHLGAIVGWWRETGTVVERGRLMGHAYYSPSSGTPNRAV